ncbi:MAG: hypothetical protein ACP5QZ_08920 [Candidatus Sumerlaeaceae bacterium]|jgi:hypothetical protein
MGESSRQTGIFRLLAILVAMVTGWVYFSREPIAKLVESYERVSHEREQVALLEQQVQLLERQLRSTKALGTDFEIQLRQAGMAKPYEKVIFLKPETVTTTASSMLTTSALDLRGDELQPAQATEQRDGQRAARNRVTTSTRVKKTFSRK